MACTHYTNISITGYNASPPPDDGSETSANAATWSGIKDKLTDPIKTALETMDSNIESFCSAVVSTYATKASIQHLRTVDTTNQTGTTVMPADNTIPQKTEGDEYITQAVTPSATTTTLIIWGILNVYMDSAGPDPIVAALFKDTDADALAAFEINHTGNLDRGILLVSYQMTSGTTDEITFKLRAGRGNSNGTLMGINGRYGGTTQSFLEVIELP